MTVGRYTFEEEIGRGASGPVWRGRDTVLGRTVALKRVDTPLGDMSPDAEHGAREARLAAALNHPYVVGVFDLFVTGDEHWLVMEHVAGTTLAHLVRDRGPLPGAEASALLSQVAEALDAAHRAGIVHRDVKPSNILVTADGTAKLTDFGIARTVEDASYTLTGQVTGSPAYIAPEVATGSPATPASDVWSLGATLYHLIAGHPPYHVGDNVLSTMYRIVHEDPPRLPAMGRINDVLERTMSVDPSQRWTMARVHEALAHLAQAAGTPGLIDVSASLPRGPAAWIDPSPTRSTHAIAPVGSSGSRAWSGRRRWALLSAGGVLVAGMAVVVFTTGLIGADSSGERVLTAPQGATDGGVDVVNQNEVTEDQLESFVTDYLSTVTRDPRAGWERLTPGFQEASNGYRSYADFWGTVSTATATDIRADPATMRVTYVVDYKMRDGSRNSDTVTLGLVFDDDSLLIAKEY